MKSLIETLDERLVKVPLDSDTAFLAIDELVDLYAKVKGTSEEEKRNISRLVKEREEAASTYLGAGAAVPHAKVNGIKEAKVILGISQKGVSFKEGVANLIFLVITPEERPSEHIALLSSIAKACSSPSILRLLISSTTPAEAIRVF